MADDELAPGASFGAFTIEAVVGRGGMGVVYRARQPELGRDVALKVIATSLADDPAFRARFRTEAAMTAAVEHPGIVPVYETGEVDGLPYIAVRYADGTDLRRLIDAAPLHPERAVEILEPVAAALDAAHRRGLVHGDVKPANILVGDEGDPHIVYLSDFGLARGFATEPDGGDRWSGTPQYVAPELRTGGAVAGRADLYALGCVLFESLTGRPPFDGPDDVAVLRAHVEAPAPAVSAVRPELGASLDAVLQRALAKDPPARQGSCRELVAEARGALVGAEASSHAPPGATPGHAPRPGREAPPAPPARVPTLVDARSPARRRARRDGRPSVGVAAALAGLVVVLAALVVLDRLA